MSDQTVNELFQKIQAEAEAASGDQRLVRTCQEGDEIRQGDIYLYPIDEERVLPGAERPTRQLAEGSGPGSRHVIKGDAVAYSRARGAGVLEGPFVHARQRVVLTHPEHADISLPSGWYEVRYQRDFTARDVVIRRVRD